MTEPELQGDHARAAVAGGTGSSDLATDSSDPGELHALLRRARERLSFYEGFDRVIAENVRRSGELMLETLTMREQAVANAGPVNQGNREQLISRLSELSTGVDAARSQIDSLSIQIDALRALVGEADMAPRPPAIADSPTTSISQPEAHKPKGDDDWASERAIDVIVHHVTRAAIALSLQRHLGNLEAVAGVEAREFAEGVLRMQVTARQPLDRADFAGWTEFGPITVLQMRSNAIELEIG